jgi:hypothetical protein
VGNTYALKVRIDAVVSAIDGLYMSNIKPTMDKMPITDVVKSKSEGHLVIDTEYIRILEANLLANFSFTDSTGKYRWGTYMAYPDYDEPKVIDDEALNKPIPVSEAVFRLFGNVHPTAALYAKHKMTPPPPYSEDIARRLMILHHRQRMEQTSLPVNASYENLATQYVDKYIAEQKAKATTAKATIMNGANNGVNAQKQATAVTLSNKPANALANTMTGIAK